MMVQFLMEKNCLKFGAKCIIKMDAFYFLTIFCTFIGVLWMLWFKKTVFSLQSLAKNCWKISNLHVKKNPLILK